MNTLKISLNDHHYLIDIHESSRYGILECKIYQAMRDFHKDMAKVYDDYARLKQGLYEIALHHPDLKDWVSKIMDGSNE